MLVLSRGCDSEIRIGRDITIKVLAIHKRQVKLGIEAPSGLSIWRGELLPLPNHEEPCGLNEGRNVVDAFRIDFRKGRNR